jgi:hypothetical protein
MAQSRGWQAVRISQIASSHFVLLLLLLSCLQLILCIVACFRFSQGRIHLKSYTSTWYRFFPATWLHLACTAAAADQGPTGSIPLLLRLCSTASSSCAAAPPFPPHQLLGNSSSSSSACTLLLSHTQMPPLKHLRLATLQKQQRQQQQQSGPPSTTPCRSLSCGAKPGMAWHCSLTAAAASGCGRHTRRQSRCR